MTARLDTRLRALEAASGRAGADALPGVVVLPEGMAMSGEAVDRLVTAHRERTGWRGTLVLLPANGRDAAREEDRSIFKEINNEH